MAITRLNSLAIPAGTVVSADLTYPLTTFSSTGIDDNAASTAITIDSSGNLLVGTTNVANSATVSGHYILPSGLHTSTRDGGAIRILNRLTSDGDLMIFRKDNVGVGVIGTQNWGIGTTSPGRTLDVEGIIRSNGTSSAFALGGNSSTPTEGAAIHRPANGTIAFVNESSESMRIDSSGRVGIGVSSPAEMLDINEGSTATYIRLRNATSTTGYIGYGTTASATDMTFWTGGNKQVTIDGSGRLLLGISSSVSVTGGERQFQISGTNGVTSSAVIRRSQNSSGAPSLSFAKDRGSVSTVVASGDALGAIYFAGSDGTDLTNDSAAIISYADGTPSSNNMPGVLVFSTNGGSTSSTERMRINSAGHLLVGCTSAMGGGGSDGINGFGAQGSGGGRFVAIQNTTDANMYLAKNSGYNNNTFIWFYVTGSQVGSIVKSGSGVAYNTTSDERLKDNIVDAPAGNIDAIRVRSFDWKADGSHQPYGMVAQELVDVAPEAVTQGETDDDMWQVDYSKLVPMMIKEIQDLKAEVAALKGA